MGGTSALCSVIIWSEPDAGIDADVVDFDVDVGRELGIALLVFELYPLDVDVGEVETAAEAPSLAEQILDGRSREPLPALDVADLDVEPPEPGDEPPALREQTPVLEVKVR